MMPISLILIAHDLRSTHNVGSLLRTADGLGVKKLYFTGYSPYPNHPNDIRLPHLSEKISKQIDKTALGAQNSIAWEYNEDVLILIKNLKSEGYSVAGLEQTAKAIQLPEYRPADKLALVLGSEVTGISKELLAVIDFCLEIPMYGSKESYNVIEAATMAMYHCLVVSR